MAALLSGSAWLAHAGAGNVTYTYDSAGRLTGASYSDGSGQTYTLDPAGNRTAVSSGNPAAFSISSPAPVAEGGAVTITVTKSGAPLGSTQVSYQTADGTAHQGLNYTATSGTLTFAPTDTSKTFTVQTIDDHSYDGTLGFSVQLLNAVGGTISQTSAPVTLNEVDPVPSFAISAPAASNEGSTQTFTVSKANATSLGFAVNYATANGTALAGSDYTAASGTFSFAPADTSKTFTVATIHNSVYTGTISYTASLSGATGVSTISQPNATGIINDIDPAPVLAINSPAPVNEGQPVTFTVTKTNATRYTSNVNYATANGTAIAGTNYTAASATLSFAPTVTSNTITVQSLDDHVVTASKTFTVNLSAPTNGATIGTATGTESLNEIDNVIPATPNLTPATQIAFFPNGGLSFQWTAGSTVPVTSFQLYQSQNGGANTLVYSGTAPGWASGAMPRATYVYSLAACNANGCSGYATATATVTRGGS